MAGRFLGGEYALDMPHYEIHRVALLTPELERMDSKTLEQEFRKACEKYAEAIALNQSCNEFSKMRILEAKTKFNCVAIVWYNRKHQKQKVRETPKRIDHGVRLGRRPGTGKGGEQGGGAGSDGQRKAAGN